MAENQRTRLSKMLLRNSLTQLLQNRSIRKISVREICEHAQINRTTFYKYYDSQYDLLGEIERDFIEEVEKCLPQKVGGELAHFTRMLMYFEENRALCRILMDNSPDTDFQERLMNLPRIREVVDDTLAGQYRDEELEYIYRFIAIGGFGVIKGWLDKEQREPPEQLAHFIERSIMKLF